MGERRGHYHANYCSVDPEPSVYECEESHDLRSLVIDIAAFMYAAGMVDEARWSNSLRDLSDHIIRSRYVTQFEPSEMSLSTLVLKSLPIVV